MGKESNQPESTQAAPQAAIPQTAAQRKAAQQDNINILRQQQLSGDESKTSKSSTGKPIIDYEKHLVHVNLVTKHHDVTNKRYVTNSRTIKTPVNMYQQMLIDRSFSVYDAVEVVHDPRTKEQVKAFDKVLDNINKKRAGGSKE